MKSSCFASFAVVLRNSSICMVRSGESPHLSHARTCTCERITGAAHEGEPERALKARIRSPVTMTTGSELHEPTLLAEERLARCRSAPPVKDVVCGVNTIDEIHHVLFQEARHIHHLKLIPATRCSTASMVRSTTRPQADRGELHLHVLSAGDFILLTQ